MDDAVATIAGVLTDLHQVNRSLAAHPLDTAAARRAAQLLDRLAAELTQAAAAVRQATP